MELNPQELPDEDGEFERQQKLQQHCTDLFVFIVHVLLIFVFSLTLSLLPLSDDFPESTGVKRIIQALNANVWSSVKMKDGEMTPMQLPIALLLYLIYLYASMYGV